jgi:Glycosyl hydrolases family 15
MSRVLDEDIARLLRQVNTQHDLRILRAFLEAKGTFDFPCLATGLFPAANLSERGEYTGYSNCWVRDNIHIAHAHFAVGNSTVAKKNVLSLAEYFKEHRSRFEGIIAGVVDTTDPMSRPHIRFNGLTLQELPETWSHAQNDALGYFLWFFCKLARAGLIKAEVGHWELLGLFVLFFRAICYWKDEDSGHWEEAKKIEASSVGVVLGALEMMRKLMIEQHTQEFEVFDRVINIELLDELISEGSATLNQILPAECIQPGRERLFDSALLFLIYPVRVTSDTQTKAIITGIETQLKGEYGIKRYLGDSFWCANYDELISEDSRTKDFSVDMTARDALAKPGEEAQWCVFDPILSVIYGQLYERSEDKQYLAKQTEHLSRSLGQLTSADSGFRPYSCPELYYRKHARYIPNDVTPLLWTQANLMMALHDAERTAK